MTMLKLTVLTHSRTHARTLLADCNNSVQINACYNRPRDAWCNLPINNSESMMLALREAMNWPTWSTIWLPAYPLLQNITWGPSATIDNSAINNVAVGQGILGFGEQPKQFWKYEYYKKVGSAGLWTAEYVMHGNWNASDIAVAQFVATDPVVARDFRLKSTSPVFKAGTFHQIPAGQGIRKAPP
jgi:hypothetical protein